MVRNYKRKTEDRWNKEDLLEALLCIKDAKLKINDVSEQYGISRATLYRHYQKFILAGGKCDVNQFRNCGGAPILTKVEEDVLEKTIKDLREQGYTVIASDIRRICFEYCDSNGIPNQFNQERRIASGDWYYGFLKRHPDIRTRKERQRDITSHASSITSSASSTSRNIPPMCEKLMLTSPGKGRNQKQGDVAAAAVARKKPLKRIIPTKPRVSPGKEGMAMLQYVPIDKEEEMIKEEIDSGGSEDGDMEERAMNLGDDYVQGGGMNLCDDDVQGGGMNIWDDDVQAGEVIFKVADVEEVMQIWDGNDHDSEGVEVDKDVVTSAQNDDGGKHEYEIFYVCFR
ncbi:unnamed protein product [Orchesella dallaii]|uniref:HTH psq-type domain-containing protein n=1 Tax=Orchesella dallaii TaxID=48710 RepID=A0ABP1PV16_9HEXA